MQYICFLAWTNSIPNYNPVSWAQPLHLGNTRLNWSTCLGCDLPATSVKIFILDIPSEWVKRCDSWEMAFHPTFHQTKGNPMAFQTRTHTCYMFHVVRPPFFWANYYKFPKPKSNGVFFGEGESLQKNPRHLRWPQLVPKVPILRCHWCVWHPTYPAMALTLHWKPPKSVQPMGWWQHWPITW